MINEVKIDNWVEVFLTKEEKIFGKGFYGQITAIIAPNTVWVSKDYGSHTIDKIKLVPITDAILIGGGLIKDNYGIFIKYKNNKAAHGEEIEFWIKQYIKNDKPTWDVCIGQNFGNLCSVGNIDYVHELQNLSYFLCGRKEIAFQL